MGNCATVEKEKPPENSRGIDPLLKIDPDSVPDIPFQNQMIPIRVFDIHDGDTVSFLMLYGNKPLKMHMRILGIDTPEVRSAEDRLAEEKTAGMIARRRLMELIGINKITSAVLRDNDKYGGRVLGELYAQNGKSIASILLAEGYAKPYVGGKKLPWTMQELAAKPFEVI
jgi:micrococcal nuclease